jgi:hypothetical protein
MWSFGCAHHRSLNEVVTFQITQLLGQDFWRYAVNGALNVRKAKSTALKQTPYDPRSPYARDNGEVLF